MENFEKIKHIKDVAARRKKADLKIKNVKLVNVITQEIEATDVLVSEGIICGLGRGEALQEYDAKGMYLAPNLIDSHMHIESTLLTPSKLNRLLIDKGIGTIIADPHEIANVLGVKGINYMIESSQDLDLDVQICLPSCVPATQFEDCYGKLGAEDICSLYENKKVVGLAEVMDYVSILEDDDMLKKIYDAKMKGKNIDGHGSIIDKVGCDVYSVLNIKTDHECVNSRQFYDRIKRGMYVLIREGTAAKNLKDLIKEVNYKNYHQVCLCTDDRHLDDIVKEGGVDHALRKAIKLGLDPIMALTLCTYNPARCFDLKGKGAIIPGNYADFFLFKDLNDIKAEKVFVKGKIIEKDREEKTISLTNTINYQPFSIEDMQIKINQDKANIIKINPGSIVTDLIIETVKKDQDNNFCCDIKNDQLKLLVIERHHKLGKIGKAIVKGFRLQKGAIATSVAHDSHNIIVVGTNDEDMFKAVEHLKNIGGGYVVVANGKVEADVRLEIAGLMTNSSIEELLIQLDNIHHAIAKIAQEIQFNPLVMLSFISLPVIGEAKLTDRGLFNVYEQRFIDISVDN